MRVLSKLRSPWTVTMIGAILDYNCDPVLVMEVRSRCWGVGSGRGHVAEHFSL
jgi:hypothetical protein